MSEQRRGKFLGMPYDWRRLTRKRVRDELWNPIESRVFVPKAYGWGYGVNFAALWGRLTGRRAAAR